MGLFDTLRDALNQGSDTNSRKSDESVDVENDNWPYYFEEIATENIGDYELLSVGYPYNDDIRDDPEAYAGEWPRDIMDLRRFNEKAPTYLGYTEDTVKGVTKVGVDHGSLWQHLAFFGQTGYGKSTVLKNNMHQWIQSGYGVCFIDRMGHDVKEMLRMIPENRLEDVVWVEPGETEYDKTVGFNFFETYRDAGEKGFEYEVDNIVDNFVKVIKADEGARMESVAKSLTRQLVRADNSYTPIEFHFILSDQEERKIFAEHFGDQLEKPFLERVASMDAEELDALSRRFKNIIENKSLLNVVAHRESSISIGEAVKEGKILLVNLSGIGDKDIQRLISTVISRRIWAAVKERSELEPHEFDPFFLVIDEFAKIEQKELEISEILSEARKYKLSVTLATQQLRQLSEASQKAVENNCKSIFTFRVGTANVEDANKLSKSFENVSPEMLLDIEEYSLIGRIFSETGESSTVKINTFAPYPPYRGPEEAERQIRKSMERYGTKQIDSEEQDWSEYKISNRLEETGEKEPDPEEDQSITVNDHGDKITPRQVLEAIHTASIRHETLNIDDSDGWVKYDDIITEIEKYLPLDHDITSDTAIDNLFEKIPDSHVDRELVNGEITLKLTADGEEAAYVIQDSGTSGSGGKKLHRMILRKGTESLTKLGYYPTIPKQIGDEQPDGLASPPIKPREDSTNIKEAKQLMERLETEYPQLSALFDDNELAIESETTTPDKPKQTLKNIAKAMEKGRKCVLLAPDGLLKKENPNDLSPEEWKACFNNVARKIETIINSPPCVKEITDEKRVFYNEGPLRLSNGRTAVQKRKDTSQVNIWEELNGGTIQLRMQGEERPVTTFNSASELENPKPYKFDYHSYRDNKRGSTVVVDNNEEIVAEYENKTEMKKEWKPIYKPLIPEHIFPSGELPRRDQWEIIIIPDKSRDIEPQVYRENTYIPLLTGDVDNLVALDTILNDKPLPKSTQDKSTTEHIKDSDEVWTKPEKDDDDYNPAKDPENFDKTTDEYHHEHGDGGVARQEDKHQEMKDYKTPNMKKREEEKQKIKEEHEDSEEEEEEEEKEEDETVPNRNRESTLFNEVEI